MTHGSYRDMVRLSVNHP